MKLNVNTKIIKEKEYDFFGERIIVRLVEMNAPSKTKRILRLYSDFIIKEISISELNKRLLKGADLKEGKK